MELIKGMTEKIKCKKVAIDRKRQVATGNRKLKKAEKVNRDRIRQHALMKAACSENPEEIKEQLDIVKMSEEKSEVDKTQVITAAIAAAGLVTSSAVVNSADKNGIITRPIQGVCDKVTGAFTNVLGKIIKK